MYDISAAIGTSIAHNIESANGKNNEDIMFFLGLLLFLYYKFRENQHMLVCHIHNTVLVLSLRGLHKRLKILSALV